MAPAPNFRVFVQTDVVVVVMMVIELSQSMCFNSPVHGEIKKKSENRTWWQHLGHSLYFHYFKTRVICLTEEKQ